VLINLLLNAVQASPTGQSVSVCCRESGGSICIEVADCGCGIPPESSAKVFSPFFTTKKEGTGLGLSIVSKIVEAHQGRIEILDNRGRGTIFRVEIPFPAA
jgi:signal transduction histidine kinase